MIGRSAHTPPSYVELQQLIGQIESLLDEVRTLMVEYTPAVSKREAFREIQVRTKFALAQVSMLNADLKRSLYHATCVICQQPFLAIDTRRPSKISTEGILVPEPVCVSCLDAYAAKGVEYAAATRVWKQLISRLDRLD